MCKYVRFNFLWLSRAFDPHLSPDLRLSNVLLTNPRQLLSNQHINDSVSSESC